MAEPALIVDRHATLRHLNPAAEALLGWSLAEVIGAPLAVLLPRRDPAQPDEPVDFRGVMGLPRSFTFRTKSDALLTRQFIVNELPEGAFVAVGNALRRNASEMALDDSAFSLSRTDSSGPELTSSFSTDSSEGRPPLLSTVRSGDLAGLQQLAAGDRSVLQSRDYEGRTALHHAVIAGHADLVKFLVERAPTCLDVRDCDGKTPLDLARDSSAEDIVQLLLSPRKPPEQPPSTYALVL